MLRLPHLLVRPASQVALALCVLGMAGCAGSAPEDAASQRPAPAHPRWDASSIGVHLRALQEALEEDEAQRGRAGPRGEAPRSEALRYAAAQMQRYGVQPVLEGRYVFGAQTGPGSEIGAGGYVAGKHPARSRELVIVCADLGRSLADAAAVLELARVYAAFARFGLVPERTILFALWSSGAGPSAGAEAFPGAEAAPNRAGLAAFLRNPTWSMERVRAVLYAGLEPRREAALRTLVQPYGMRFYAIQAEPPVQERSSAQPAAAEGEQPLPRALRLARRTHGVLLPEVIEAAPLLPALGDTARVPAPQR